MYKSNSRENKVMKRRIRKEIIKFFVKINSLSIVDDYVSFVSLSLIIEIDIKILIIIKLSRY